MRHYCRLAMQHHLDYGGDLTIVQEMKRHYQKVLEADTVLPAVLGEAFVASYVKLKYREWQDYCAQVSPWELDHTLDC